MPIKLPRPLPLPSPLLLLHTKPQLPPQLRPPFLPRSTTDMSTKPYDPIALTGFSAAASYDAHRPSYIAPALTHLLEQLNVASVPHAKILDLAAGTGKLTELLAARPEEYKVVAVEPHKDMLAALRAKDLKGVSVKEGNAYDIPVEDGWADATVVAQAFHWFSNPASLASIARTLRPGSRLGLIWNVEDYNQSRHYATKTRWEGQLRDLNWQHTTDASPRYKNNEWAGAFTPPTTFSALQEKIFEVEIWLGKEALWRRLGTLSNIANLGEGDRGELRKGFDEILEGEDVQRNDEGEIAVHYIVHTAWATKL
ncbi:S-adenosyl-L-methionine-dependent methyltransferase [Morchella snyderi]|nr:S-adenosyl-L-methionine-dependent methyltransferase [Morchella snyderi]